MVCHCDHVSARSFEEVIADFEAAVGSVEDDAYFVSCITTSERESHIIRE